MKRRHKILLGCIWVSLILVPLFGKSFVKDKFIFIERFISNPSSVGSITPSSSFLAAEITKYIAPESDSIKILEVGAGTGIFTKRIISKLRPGDVFDVIEIDPELCGVMKKQFDGLNNVTINCLSILDWKPKYKYDYIVSGLPFNAFEASFVDAILKHYEKLIKPDGILSYFEYIALADIKKMFLSGEKLEKYQKVQEVTSMFRAKYEFELVKIFANFPPAYVHFLRINELKSL